MADYNKATNFTAKDGLPTGNAGKIIKGTEIDTEFTAIASAIASKADINSPSFTGTPAGPTASLGSNTTQLANTAFVTAGLAALIPTGVITLWSGSIASIPSGWVLCNGSNSTPDLRDRFVVGAGTTYAVGATGGANTVTLDATMIPAHTHTFSATTGTESAGHTHTYSGTSSGQSVGHTHSGTTGGMNANNPHSHAILYGPRSGGSNGVADSSSTGGYWQSESTNIDHGHDFTTGGASADHNHTYSGTTAGTSVSHTHTVSGTTGNGTGGGAAHENRPPYFALAYIMKS